MKENKYIISSNGFYQNSYFDKEKREIIIEWCERISDAKALSNKRAKAFIKKHNIDAFLWSPFTEYHTEKRYKIDLIRKNIYYDEYPTYAVWEFTQVYDKTDSDLKFLNDRNKTPEKTYTLAEAKKIVFKKNKELMELINIDNKKYIEEQAHKFKI